MDLPKLDFTGFDEDSKSKIFMCPFEDCEASFGKNSKVLNHVRKHTGERPYVCDEKDCTKAYTNSSHLRRHKAMLHAKREKVLCTHPGCKLEFYNVSNMKRHLSRAHDVNRKYPFMCDKCNEGFSKERLLKKHSAVHTGLLGFECSVCNMRFAISTDLYRHKRTHTTYTCECGEQYERWIALLKHKREVHKPDTTCSECGKKFADINILRQHKKKIHVPVENITVFPCPRDGCMNTYMYKKNLKEHIKYYHDKKPKKKIPCPIEGCGAFLSRMQCLKKHLELHKTGIVRKVNRKSRFDTGMPKKSTVSELSGVSLSHEENMTLLNAGTVDVDVLIGQRGRLNPEEHITVTPDIQTDFVHQDEDVDTSDTEIAPNISMEDDCETPEISGDLDDDEWNENEDETSDPGILKPVDDDDDDEVSNSSEEPESMEGDILKPFKISDKEEDISKPNDNDEEDGISNQNCKDDMVLHNALDTNTLNSDPLEITESKESEDEQNSTDNYDSVFEPNQQKTNASAKFEHVDNILSKPSAGLESENSILCQVDKDLPQHTVSQADGVNFNQQNQNDFSDAYESNSDESSQDDTADANDSNFNELSQNDTADAHECNSDESSQDYTSDANESNLNELSQNDTVDAHESNSDESSQDDTGVASESLNELSQNDTADAHESNSNESLHDDTVDAHESTFDELSSHDTTDENNFEQHINIRVDEEFPQHDISYSVSDMSIESQESNVDEQINCQIRSTK